jgi:hypothetical protein
MLTETAYADAAPRVETRAALETPETERIEVPAPEAIPSPDPVPAAVPDGPVPEPVPSGT